MICHPCRYAADHGKPHYHCLAGTPSANETVLTRQQRESLCACQHRIPKGSTEDDNAAVPGQQPVSQSAGEKVRPSAKASSRPKPRVRPLRNGSAEAGIRV